MEESRTATAMQSAQKTHKHRQTDKHTRELLLLTQTADIKISKTKTPLSGGELKAEGGQF